jgi:hypothetical protein
MCTYHREVKMIFLVVRDQFRLLMKMQINWALTKAEAASLYWSFHLKVKVKPAVILLVSRDTIIQQLMSKYSCLKNVSFATLSENKMYQVYSSLIMHLVTLQLKKKESIMIHTVLWDFRRESMYVYKNFYLGMENSTYVRVFMHTSRQGVCAHTIEKLRSF